MKVLISTLWDGTRVPFVINKINPDKIYFIMDEHPQRTEAYKQIEMGFPHKKINKINIEDYDIYEITKKITEVMKIELDKGHELLICVSEAMKQMSFALTYAAYLHADQIEGIYNVMHETGEIIKLPLLNIDLKNGKKEVLQIINSLSSKEGLIKGADISSKAKLKKTAVYENLKELIRVGFIDKETNKLTVFGKICLLR